jgi:hypothetical protein
MDVDGVKQCREGGRDREAERERRGSEAHTASERQVHEGQIRATKQERGRGQDSEKRGDECGKWSGGGGRRGEEGVMTPSPPSHCRSDTGFSFLLFPLGAKEAVPEA